MKLGELVNQSYGIKEIEQLNSQIHANRVKKIHVGLLMRAVKSQDYSKISGDFKEVEAVTKMTQIWGSIGKPLQELLINYKESKKPLQDLKAIINEKLTNGGYKNEMYAKVQPR